MKRSSRSSPSPSRSVLGTAVSPFASQPARRPRARRHRPGLHRRGERPATPIPDYAFPGIENERLATGLAGFIGTLLVFGAGYGVVAVRSAGAHERLPRQPASPATAQPDPPPRPAGEADRAERRSRSSRCRRRCARGPSYAACAAALTPSRRSRASPAHALGRAQSCSRSCSSSRLRAVRARGRPGRPRPVTVSDGPGDVRHGQRRRRSSARSARSCSARRRASRTCCTRSSACARRGCWC